MKKPIQIKTLAALYKAANLKQCVVCPGSRCFENHTPAAFIMSMQGQRILPLLNLGLYIYQPKRKKCHKNH